MSKNKYEINNMLWVFSKQPKESFRGYKTVE